MLDSRRRKTYDPTRKGKDAMRARSCAPILAFGGCLFFAVANTHAYDGAACVEHEVLRGTHCGKGESADLLVTNNCRDPMYVKVCWERANHDWDCGVDSSLKPAKKNGFWTCASTGRYKWAACTDEKECTFKDPKRGD